MPSMQIIVVSQIHHDIDVLEELKFLEQKAEGFSVLSVGFDGRVLVKVSAETMDDFKHRLFRLRQTSYCQSIIQKAETFEK